MSKLTEVFSQERGTKQWPYRATVMDDGGRLVSASVEVDGYASLMPIVPERIEAIQSWHSYDLNDPKEIMAMKKDMKELSEWYRRMAKAISRMERSVLPKLKSYAKRTAHK